jgi:hypothetical protein
MIYTTLKRIRKHSPCTESWKKILAHLGKTKADDEPISFVTILDSNGLDDALWCCRAEPKHASLWRHFAVDCAESVRHLMTDKRSLDALDVARRHASGQATSGELAVARVAALTNSSSAALAAVLAATNSDARYAAREAAWEAAWDSFSADVNLVSWGKLENRFRYLVTVGEWTPIGK